MSAVTANVAVAIAVSLTGIGAILAAVAFTAYARVNHARLGLVGLAMLAFAAKGVWLTRDFYSRRSEIAAGWDAIVWLAVVDLGIILALYLAVLRD